MKGLDVDVLLLHLIILHISHLDVQHFFYSSLILGRIFVSNTASLIIRFVLVLVSSVVSVHLSDWLIERE